MGFWHPLQYRVLSFSFNEKYQMSDGSICFLEKNVHFPKPNEYITEFGKWRKFMENEELYYQISDITYEDDIKFSNTMIFTVGDFWISSGTSFPKLLFLPFDHNWLDLYFRNTFKRTVFLQNYHKLDFYLNLNQFQKINSISYQLKHSFIGHSDFHKSLLLTRKMRRFQMSEIFIS